MLLTPDAQHRNVFSEVPIVGFKRGGSLKDLLVRAKVPVHKKKQMENLVVFRENAAKFALFKKKRTLLLIKRVVIHII